jgi:hypothetical protein
MREGFEVGIVGSFLRRAGHGSGVPPLPWTPGDVRLQGPVMRRRPEIEKPPRLWGLPHGGCGVRRRPRPYVEAVAYCHVAYPPLQRTHPNVLTGKEAS